MGALISRSVNDAAGSHGDSREHFEQVCISFATIFKKTFFLRCDCFRRILFRREGLTQATAISKVLLFGIAIPYTERTPIYLFRGEFYRASNLSKKIPLMKKRQNTSQETRKQFTRLMPLAGVVAALVALTGAAPIGIKSIGIKTEPTLGNYPATTTMLSANTTVTPDAAPINATSMNVSTSTNFKGTLDGDPTTGVVRVIDAHPAGTYAITVKAYDGSGASTTKTFALTVTTGIICGSSLNFAVVANFGAGNNPRSVAVGDFNGDGKQDLAVANENSGNVSILLGDGAGSFSTATNFGAGDSPYSVAVGDFNGDGKQDLAVANENSGNVSILLGDGAGSFSSATNFGAGNSPYSVAVGDFNGDGKQDLAVANFNSDNVSILLGNGAGSFSTATNFGAGSSPTSVAVGDFNSDGKQDLAVTNFNSDNVSILLGDGAGGFSAASNFHAGFQPYSVAVGDFNGDGRQDLAVSDQVVGLVAILLGNGASHFSAATYFLAGSGAYSVALGDFNGDGKQDLAVADQVVDEVSIFAGNGAGSFSAATNFGAGNSPTSVAVGDFNGDGRQDLAMTNENSGTVSILLGNCPVPTLGNYPATSISLSTNTTVVPDAAPINAARMTVSTSIDFKGTLEGDPTTGVVRVTDAHPAGTYTVMVAAFNNTGGETSTTFAVTVSAPETCNPVSFSFATAFGVTDRTVSLVVGDFNGDGKQDLATVNSPINSVGEVSILLGNGVGSFSAPTNFGGVGASLSSELVVGDFNGDGKQDLAVSGVTILLGNGTGSFSPPTHFPAGASDDGLAVGDFNGDGRQDLVEADANSDAVSILLGNGTGGFSAPRNFSAGHHPFAVAVADFNGDGKQDLAVLRFCCPYGLSILLGDGLGAFSPPTFPSVAGAPQSIAVGDFNSDGKQDLALASSSGILIMLGDGSGGFGTSTTFDAGALPQSVAVGDFNGDGKQDLAVALSEFDLSILLGDGSGAFSAPTKFSTGNVFNPHPVVVGDFNGDGRQDLAVALPSQNNVSVLLRNCATDQCTVCHKHTTTLTLPCNSIEYRRHLDHGDSAGVCPPSKKPSDQTDSLGQD